MGGLCQKGARSPWQNALPTLMIWLVSVPDGQDSAAQSRTPKPKFMFVQRQVMLLLAHPRPGANASMLLMHVFCVSACCQPFCSYDCALARDGGDLHRKEGGC